MHATTAACVVAALLGLWAAPAASEPSPCTPDCTGKACGDDGCGGSCGACSGETPVCDPPSGQCVADTCGPFDALGCCEGSTLVLCSGNQFAKVDCAQQEGAVCGWYPGDDTNAAGYYCGPPLDEQGAPLLDPAGDPSGQHPIACPPCAPACDGRPVCASDGCGGSCGCAPPARCELGACLLPEPGDCDGRECGAGLWGGWCGDCEAPAACVQGHCCTADCAGKECGDDGCGGSCGSCLGLCVGGTCEVATPACDGITYEGCCADTWVRWCENGTIQEIDCASDPQSTGPLCGWDAAAGYYGCGDQATEDPSGSFPYACLGDCFCLPGDCEENDCGAWCYSCPLPDDQCVDGHCVCSPDCTGRACGDDGCGGSCGTCPGLCGASQPAPCDDGVCAVACCPSCAGRECGDDGCGGSCGACQGGTCANGACVVDGPEVVPSGEVDEPSEIAEVSLDAGSDAPPDAGVDGGTDLAGAGHGGGGACQAGPSGARAMLALFLLLLLGLAARTRRRA